MDSLLLRSVLLLALASRAWANKQVQTKPFALGEEVSVECRNRVTGNYVACICDFELCQQCLTFARLQQHLQVSGTLNLRAMRRDSHSNLHSERILLCTVDGCSRMRTSIT